MIEQLFAKEGDTVLVGGDLFSINLDTSSGAMASITETKPDAEPAVKKPEPVKMEPKMNESSNPQKHDTNGRTPLIKFLGPRKSLWEKEPAKHQPKLVEKPIKDIFDELPKRFRRSGYSAAEMEAIDVIIFNSLDIVTSSNLNKIVVQNAQICIRY